ncbi:MAG: hypothetical protein Q8N23_13235 [Archangium sp.]|nr:hypothetical protein [Archangium sp.]MDP3153635.1 hypothetical protein [Archangium sp.]MDP3576374.1 hypothetical protein [Archangium sp.]
MIAILGLALFHLAGSAIRQLTTRCGWGVALRSPSSAWFAIAVAYACSLGVAGVGILLGLALLVTQGGSFTPARIGRVWWGLFGLVLARPLVPTWWDEFVWLGKARFESLGFGAGVQAALDPAQHVIPAGYPPLWPSAVGWLSLGHDALSTQVLAASLLVLLCAATALETLSLSRPRLLVIAVLASAPFVWLHARSTYVDLPIGLLGLAVVGLLLRTTDGRPPLLAAALAVVLAGFKDEGLAQVIAATGAALLVQGFRKWRLALPALLALLTMATWRWLVHSHGVPLFDHALGVPQWNWIPRLVELLAFHASDVFTWGVFWAVTLAVVLTPSKDPAVRTLRVMWVLLLLFTVVALLAGPERVRVFAENGTLLNRLLLQLWPCAAVMVIAGLPAPVSFTGRGA